MAADNSSSSGLFGLIVFIVICVFIYNHWIKKDYSKPWWTGTATQQVCKVPYYSSSDCYSLPVTAEDDRIVSLTFPNGGYFNIIDAECVKAASTYNFDQFCTFTNDGDEWEIMPSYASY